MRTFLLFLCIPLLLSAQEVEVKRERTYNASGLYGFMNGGTDQFLEYGVKQLVVRDIIFKGEEYVVEIYDMPTPEDAFGIYSLHTFRCERADTLNCINCLSPYQLQAVSGNQYVSIVFPSGSAVAQQNADELMHVYAPADEAFAFPSELLLEHPISGKVKLLKGPLSLSSASSSLTKLMEGIPYIAIWYIADRASAGYTACVFLAESYPVERFKDRVSPSNIQSVGSNYITITGSDQEEEEDFGSFGF